MNQQLLLENIATLPPFAQQEVFDFVNYLKQRYVSVDSQPVEAASTARVSGIS